MRDTRPIALVTGANRGIGLEICRQLALRGERVVLTARDADAGARAASAIGVSFEPLDVTDAQSIARLSASLTRQGVRIAALVNNAGVMFRRFDAEIARQTLAVNFFGALAVTDALLPLLDPGGRIVLVSSGLGDRAVLGPALRAKFAAIGEPGGPIHREQLVALMQRFVDKTADGGHQAEGWPSYPYAVSKIGMTLLAQVLDRELAADPRNLRVNAVCPGWVKTDMGGDGAERELAEGADTPVWLATEPPPGPGPGPGPGGGGGFYRDRRPASF